MNYFNKLYFEYFKTGLKKEKKRDHLTDVCKAKFGN